MSESAANYGHIAGVRQSVRGAEVCTFAVGGALEYLIEPQSDSELLDCLRYFNTTNSTWRILGAGSNVLIPDAGLPGYTLRLGRGFRFFHELGQGLFEVGGSMSLMTLARKLSAAGFSGLEFAAGIPASLGGALRMNAGAHAGQMSDVLESVTVFLPSGEERRYGADELQFGYRFTSIPDGAVISKAQLKLVAGDKHTIQKRMSECLSHRKCTQPLSLPSAGSVFKNPSEALSAGALLEAHGLKGHVIGAAQVSDLHANWIVNPAKQARATDIIRLIQECQARVLAQSGIALEREVVLW